MGQPITAPRETPPQDGLAGVAGPTGPAVWVLGSDPLDPQQHWRGPTTYTLVGDPCAAPGFTRPLGYCDLGDPDTDPALGSDDVSGLWGTLEDQHAFRIGSAVRCSTFGSPTEEQAWYEAARRGLDLSRWSQIGRELWTGVQAQVSAWTGQRYLASPDATVIGGGDAVPVVTALGMLEQAFSDCSWGATQVIHVPRSAVATMDHAGLLYTSPGSGRLWTANGSLVVADRGYPGTDPDGEDPEAGSVWAYSTGPLAARLGDVMDLPISLIGTAESNVRTARSEQPVAISWLCCHLAIRLDLTAALPSSGGGGGGGGDVDGGSP